MQRIDLPRGRWVRFERPIYISDKRRIRELSETPDIGFLDLMEGIVAVIEPAIAERSWDGPFDQLTDAELLELSNAWQQQTEDAAVPPANGTSSETP